MGLFGPRYHVLSPDEDPFEDIGYKARKRQKLFWILFAVIAIGITCGSTMLIKPQQGQAKGQPSATIQRTGSPAGQASKSITPTPSVSPTITPTNNYTVTNTRPPVVMTELVTRQVTVPVYFEFTKEVIKEKLITVVVSQPGVPYPVVTVRVITVPVSIVQTQIVTGTPQPTYTMVPTQTPWIIIYTQIVEVTSTPTFTETPTITPTPTETFTSTPTETETVTPTITSTITLPASIYP